MSHQPFDAGQIIALLEAAKFAVQVAAGILSLVGCALLATLWRMNSSLSSMDVRLARDEADIREARKKMDLHEDANEAEFRRVHDKLDVLKSEALAHRTTSFH